MEWIKRLFRNRAEERGYNEAFEKLNTGEYSISDVLDITRRLIPLIWHANYVEGMFRAIDEFKELSND